VLLPAEFIFDAHSLLPLLTACEGPNGLGGFSNFALSHLRH
jgi:hypothetical protein